MSETTVATGRLAGLIGRLPKPMIISKFALTGVLVGATHLGLVSVMALLGVPIQVALAIAFILALSLHFTLNRQWVFAGGSGYALHFSQQGRRYLATAALSYVCTAIAVAVLPGILGLPELAVFFLAAGVMACVSFLLLSVWVFVAAPDPAA
jgi:putative flippase GtrA